MATPPRPPSPPRMETPPPRPPISNKVEGSNPASIDKYYNKPAGAMRSSGGILGAIVAIFFILIIGAVLFLHKGTSGASSTVSTLGTTTIGASGLAGTTASTTSTLTTTINLGPNTYCAPAANFTCTAVNYNSIANTLTVEVSQTAGYLWTTANITFVAQNATYENMTYNGTVYQIPAVSFSSPKAVIFPSGLQSGQSVNVTLPINGLDIVSGNVTATIWAEYTVQYYPGYYYDEMANVSTPV